ncbi:GSCOCT00008155001.2-RA-CDS [Cotesia congregata]|uniref:Carboxylic ester hydrolase n=1 Tax=Cotesia congregata TaxID=51543 RepID=A0A8J2HT71_COTCN|nr:GSCOCT00008155001.2-RA-CDS [Cotesia congregata]CAG5107789.1 carboxylesterase clade B member 6 [Cotesia congregata]
MECQYTILKEFLMQNLILELINSKYILLKTNSQQADGWSGIKDATSHGATCVFYCMIRQAVVGDDDCLFINVYTPDLNKDAKRAVMVWFHPGGFNAGSGDDDIYGPDFLVEKDVILVTFNFRLGAVGFLNTLDESAPGNAGMKDQVLALEWVRNNIVNFGGCPDRVTLFGTSSGSASVHYHVMSPMSQGLFSRAIMQSGSAVNPWAFTFNPKENAMALADKFGIKTTSTAEMVKKLAEIPTKDLVQASSELAKNQNFLSGDMHVFVPSVEGDHGQKKFLSTTPWELLKSGKISDVPIILGVTADESGLFTPMVLPAADNFVDHFDLFIPSDLNVTDAGQRQMIGESIKKFYFNEKPVNSETAMELTNLLSDVYFVYGAALSGKIISSRNSAPVYEYFFTFHSPVGMMKTFFQMTEGVMHGDEMTYEFYSTALKNKPLPGSPEEKKTNEILEMWTNFAKQGNPSTTMDTAKVEWKPMGTDGNYLDIGNDLAMKKLIVNDRVKFWANIYKDVLGDYFKMFN